MSRVLSRRAVGVVLPLVLALTASVGPARAGDGQGGRPAAKAQSGIHVSGNEVRRDDYKFKSRGVIFESFQFPLEAMTACEKSPKLTKAAREFCQRHTFGQRYYLGELPGEPSGVDLARDDWKVNTIRLNLGQVMLDPQSALYRRKNADGTSWGTTYLRRIKQAVSYARQRNMVVELALFNYRLDAAQAVKVGGRSINSYDPKSGLPTYRTKRALERLVGAFKDDDEVLIEVYNEPGGNASWYLDGHAGNPTVVGVNTLLKAARAKGETNPLIVQGLGFSLGRVPLSRVQDKNVIFASHPFLGDGDRTGAADWDTVFGNAAKTKPVLLTAWGARAKEDWCRHGYGLPQKFIDYVEAREIGLTGFAFDISGTMVKNPANPPRDAPTVFKPASDPDRCTKGGAGQLIKDLFAAYAG